MTREEAVSKIDLAEQWRKNGESWSALARVTLGSEETRRSYQDAAEDAFQRANRLLHEVEAWQAVQLRLMIGANLPPTVRPG